MSALSRADRAARVALLSLPLLGPARWRGLVGAFGDDHGAWAAVRSGPLESVQVAARVTADVAARWRTRAAAVEPVDLLGAHRTYGVEVLGPGDAGWPSCFEDDPEPPIALFALGSVGALAESGVAVVGTRRCSAHGAAVARGFGRDLALAGVPVVSGLALGIDGAAHRGTLDAGGTPIAVVASGVDHVYPARHRDLWGQVAQHGVVVSEAALGTRPERWRFPARNRLIAGLAGAVVVIESGTRGGSLSTVDAAVDRNREVFAVPGPVGSEHSAGTNQLLFDGVAMARDAGDVLMAVGREATPAGPRNSSAADRGTRPSGAEAVVLRALTPAACKLDTLVDAVGLSVTEVSLCLARLEGAGLVRRTPRGYESTQP